MQRLTYKKEVLMSAEIAIQHRQAWQQKPLLRSLYALWYKEMTAQLAMGNTLELGGGSGNFKDYAPNVTSTDIVPLPWIDQVADAQNLPFGPKSFNNIVLFDVLHHIENVSLFFEESLRVLRPGGRLVMMEPYISPVSWLIYHFLHPELVDFCQDPLVWVEPDPSRKPFDANQAFATILFERQFHRFQQRYPAFKKVYQRRMAFFVYPLSGGFERRPLLPLAFLEPILKIEEGLHFLSPLLAFRMLVVLEKQS